MVKIGRLPFPVKIDPEFYFFCKDEIQKDPSLNIRKVTKKLSDNKMIIGELFHNEEFAKQVEKMYTEQQKRFGL